jgi:hypothetical protein
MLYQNIILTGFALSTTVQAAINFYGPDRDNGDYVSCQFKDVLDEHVSVFLEFFYPEQIIDGSNDFAFDEPVECDQGVLHDAQGTCLDSGGDATCIPKQNCLLSLLILCFSKRSAKRSVLHRSIGRQSTAPVEKRESGLEFDQHRSAGHTFERRDSAKCRVSSFECKNEYQSTSGRCSSGYTTTTFDVKGSTGDIWCSKPCTDEERTNCKSQACAVPRQDCEANNTVKSCRKAVFVCPAGPIKMDESICNLDTLGILGGICRSRKLKEVVYENGHCSIIAADILKARAVFAAYGRPKK